MRVICCCMALLVALTADPWAATAVLERILSEAR
jgi:hypothetical protein